ncbi:conjugative transposon protein TraN [Aestuariibaculum sp. M13]|uniref:conjugative transposon protein TraN n=1 Tax=Aestuariibaculum sp. M13 TaxID=2967132 RepID=UPI002159E1B9|nr:conjugative transposon protein TraN [Aestuariibaculum sp. M13]MCR8668220.1 conjugative transposon protein TraN [Aestuariibaculum sp. M13]
MKTYFLTIISLVVITATFAQRVALDTIYANDKMNVALFFPDYIRQGITGSEDFVFTYNREEKQYFGLLQARPGDNSNLLAITDDGQVYSYIIKYKDSISKLNYFLSPLKSIGNEKPNPKPTYIEKPKPKNKDYDYYEKFSRYLLGMDFLAERSKRKDGIVLKLLETRYHRDEVYMVFEIKNKSEIDFEIEYLKVFRVSINKKRKASYQQLELDAVYKLQFSKIVTKDNIQTFVFVFPKFSMGDNEDLEFELSEKNGNRKLNLK